MTFSGLVDSIVGFIDSAIIPLLIGLAFIFFMYGIFRLFFSEEDEKRKKGREFAIWGLLGMVILFSVWSLVRILVDALQLGGA